MVTVTREAAIAALDREIVRLSFVEFLNFVYVRPDTEPGDALFGDDAEDGGIRKFEPWPHLVERAQAWERGDSEIILKARQLGMSWLFAAYVLWVAMYRHGDIAIISKGEREAKKQLTRSKFVWDHLPSHLRVRAKFGSEEAVFTNGNSIVALPSTEDVGVSFTFRLVVMDEEGFHPYAQSNYAALEPTLSAGGQFLGGSTANPKLGPSGFFHDQYWASKRGETGYSAVFIPWYARPGRDAAWLAARRAKFVGMAEEFDAYYPETDAQAFVARSGLVYPMFSEAKHVRPARIPIAYCIRIVAGVDWGGGDPTAVGIHGLDPRQHVHQYAEKTWRGPVGVDKLAEFISQFPVRQVRCGADEPVAIQALQEALGPRYDVQAADVRRAEGLNLVGFLLEHDRLTIDPDCKDSIHEFPGYRWAERVDPNDRTRYATKTPVDHHGDHMDARRYACAELLAMLMPGASLPTRTIAGRPIRRKAV